MLIRLESLLFEHLESGGYRIGEENQCAVAMRILRWTIFFALLVLLLITWDGDSFLPNELEVFLQGLLLGLVGVFLVNLIHRTLMARKIRHLPMPEGEKVLLREPVVYLGQRRQRGMLVLTPGKLFFLYRPLHMERPNLVLPLSDLGEVQVFNQMGILPNGMEIHTLQGEKYAFLTDQRKRWMQLLQQQVPSTVYR